MLIKGLQLSKSVVMEKMGSREKMLNERHKHPLPPMSGQESSDKCWNLPLELGGSCGFTERIIGKRLSSEIQALTDSRSSLTSEYLQLSKKNTARDVVVFPLV